MILEALQNPFLQRALLAGLAASILCGILGTFVVVKQMASISGGLSHAAFGGLGLAYLLGFHPLLGATGFCLLSAVLIAIVYRKERQSLDTLIAMVWSVGMALGILFMSMKGGYAPDLNSYLFGNILFVLPEYILLVAVLDAVVLTTTFFLFKEFQAVAFDEEFAEISGVAVGPIFLLLLCLVSLGVVMLIRIVGVIMMIALLTIPAVIARQWCSNLKQMTVVATVISAACISAGLFLSYWLSETLHVQSPSSALTILLVASCYGISMTAKAARR